MSTGQPVVKRQTIKQAKADFKARGRPTLTDVQKKQIERAAQLERRAWSLKERARKTESVQKKQERERKELEERERIRMGTQRRCDRFGYKSSQLHLGGFFGAAAGKRNAPPAQAEEADTLEDGVDDMTLLEALESPEALGGPVQAQHSRPGHSLPTPPLVHSPSLRKGTHVGGMNPEAEFSSFWAQLDSSTQITRDLGGGEALPTKPALDCTSFSSGDFDLTVEEIDELPIVPVASKSQLDKQLMPPPALPFSKSKPPGHPSHSLGQPVERCSASKDLTLHSPIPGLTMTELESFVDDDLQLTQLAPG